MSSIIKVDTIQDQDGNNIINENSNTITIGASGDTVTLASGASQSGFGRTGTVDWNTTKKTADFTATNGDGFFVDTTSQAITVTLPSSPSAGNIVAVADYAGTAGTNAITIARNGSPIEGSTEDATLDTDRDTVTLVYVDATQGWVAVNSNDAATLTAKYVAASGGNSTATCGDFKIHTFTGPGTFTVSCAGNSIGNNQLEYLVVAGGGGGGNNGGGAGAGGFRFASPSLAPATYPAKPLAAPAGITAAAQAYPITVGGGGSGSLYSSGTNCSGSPSTFSSITSTGGGFGGSNPGSASTGVGNGGSGGGGSYFVAGCAPQPNFGGTGNTPPVSPPQGNDGGDTTSAGPYPSGAPATGAGGGGALAAGTDVGAPAATGGPGGVGGGLPTAFGSNGVPSGSFRFYAGGGAGAAQNNSPGDRGIGGTGGGGTSGLQEGTAGNGTANTGGGDGGSAGGNGTSGNGGSGVVIIRYKFQN